MKLKLLLLFVVLFSLQTNAQTVTALQQQNARATGYAIVAARNPGKSFSVLMIKWDGVHDLEYNANNQINPSWHPQAVVKGNYFNQGFDGTDFSYYSSVLVSQAEFDTYKSTGTDWWIVCSTLPSFSNSGLTIADNGNVGVGTTNPTSKLDINGVIQAYNIDNNGASWDNVRIWADGVNSYIESNGDENGLIIRSNTGNKILLMNNVGIGTTTPDQKLTVNGTIHSKEVIVDTNFTPDYVFQKYYTGKSELKSDYVMPTLAEIENFTKENNHLPNVPSAKEIQEKGMSLGEMSNVLLQKVEELTLYAIEQNKEIKRLKAENENYKSLAERLSAIEKELKK